MVIYVELTRPLVPATLIAVIAEMAAAALVYAVAFLSCGIKPAERRFYLAKLAELVGRSVPARSVPEGA